jgi:F-type H+-transporting ATPase subunit b
MFRKSHWAVGVVSLALLCGLIVRPASAVAAADEPAAAKAADQAATASAEGGHASAENDPDILEPQPPLVIWTMAVFVVLLIVLRAFAWKPLMEALHKREENMERILREAEHAREESERLLAEHRSQMAQAAEQIRRLLEKAHNDAKATADEIIAQAHKEAEAILHRAEREILNAKDQALIEIWNKAAEMAVSVAGRVLSRELGPDDHRRLVEVAMSELPASPAATNGHGSHA